MNNLINVFKILSDETRLRILMLLFEEELCVCEIYGILDESQPKVSKALSKLRDLGIVIDERKEKFVYYSLNKKNSLMIEILSSIKKNIDLYPQLNVDGKNMEKKDEYLQLCSLNKK
ncbi:MAG: ArsR/SmtB family transcription factor [Proteocatella sp.]